MASIPSWLPPLLSLSGSQADCLETLYRVFQADFVVQGCQSRSLPIFWDRRKHDGGPFDEGFWHIVSRMDQKAGCRKLDFKRAKRLPWCAPTIRHENDAAVKVWKQAHNGKRSQIRTYVWLEQYDYVIVLEEGTARHGPVVFLVTAYCVDGQSTRKKLQNGFINRLA